MEYSKSWSYMTTKYYHSRTMSRAVLGKNIFVLAIAREVNELNCMYHFTKYIFTNSISNKLFAHFYYRTIPLI
jgi:hypothetical protein